MSKQNVSSMRGLGPKTQDWLRQIGITTPEQLRASDPYDVYARLRAVEPKFNLNGLYGLIGAIEDRDWREIQRERRTEILLRLEELGLAPK